MLSKEIFYQRGYSSGRSELEYLGSFWSGFSGDSAGGVIGGHSGGTF